MWSGLFNFLGVLVSSGAVAFGIISLLPVELILQVGSSAGFAMVFALLIAAIVWNLGTWWLGLPASSSHTLIGSIIGVGVANALMHGRDGTSGVDWSQATKVGYSLLLSPLVGFACAALLLLVLRAAGEEPRALRGAQGQGAAAVVDPRPADPHLHRRVVRARFQRRAEGHGPDHADPRGYRTDGSYALNRAMPVNQTDAIRHHRGRGAGRALSRFGARRRAATDAAGCADATSSGPRSSETHDVMPALVAIDRRRSATQVQAHDTLAQACRRRWSPTSATTCTWLSETIRLDRQGATHITRSTRDDAQENLMTFKKRDRRRDEVHSAVGEGGRGDRARAWAR